MDLFSMGVFDDDRPKQHRPAPVRNLESELALTLPKVARCSTCLTGMPIKGKSVCMLCERESKHWSVGRAYATSRRMVRFRAKLICAGGAMIVPKVLLRTADDFVDAGNARWANRRDLHRLGLPDDVRVVILTGYP